jgi:hypothetical protein
LGCGHWFDPGRRNKGVVLVLLKKNEKRKYKREEDIGLGREDEWRKKRLKKGINKEYLKG